MTGHCKDCGYWISVNNDTGECHCKAPLPYLHHPKVETSRKMTRWPLTMQDQMCGEFKEIGHIGRLGGQAKGAGQGRR